MNQDWINALLGGVVIGAAVSLMLLLNGRVTGISGIVNGALTPVKGDVAWRWLFVAGLVLGGLVMRFIQPEVFSGQLETGLGSTIAAGLLVGFGTVMGSGCTSGHGVCGISRLSPRSLVATITFIAAGMVTVVLLRNLGILS
ncbi:YeeE/YedE family protein [Oligoflexus tunisiensis]|uniref:YeeE/YedE family protein n=1 Tax=Oligoflexus tunisiensis TaxID=708132 RepID=UPI00114C9F14|nr:YeeE/YedE family protein [Oligoflexus tunisiensis]